MLAAVNGYYNGEHIVLNENVKMHRGQRVIITILDYDVPPAVETEAPDELDKKMIADSRVDNDESMALDDFAKELGFEPNDLRV
ncbi:MAG: hypothetical protein ACI4DP_01980 [Candidatus Ornithomonoglobus sp.]